MSAEDPEKDYAKEPEFDFNKANWQSFVRRMKQFLLENKHKARWVIKSKMMLRAILKHQAAPLQVNDPSNVAETVKSNQMLMDQQLMAYNFLEKKFWKSNPTLFQKVNFLYPSFATEIFMQLDKLHSDRPEGKDYKEGKLGCCSKDLEGR
eukprot:1749670-Rhodomonas_salina.4